MTNEERKILRPLIEGVFTECGRTFTDEMVEDALNKIDKMCRESKETPYIYKHSDYGKMVKSTPEALKLLLYTGEDGVDLPEFEDFMDSCSNMDRSTLAEGVNSIIYFWLDRWHHANDDDNKDSVWLFPLQMAIMIAERFELRECLPALLETERQDRDFAETFFDECDAVGMVPACIYHIVTEEDLPMLTDFVREQGVYTFSKAEVIAAVSTLPRRMPQTLAAVQKWLCGLLEIFADHIDPKVGDVMLLEAIIHCCIHTRCEAAKPMIIRMYSKYKMPNFLIPGGVNEVRKTIKRASIGILKEELESAETIFWNSNHSEDYLDDEDDEFYDDEDDFYDDDDEDFDDEDNFFDDEDEEFDDYEEVNDEDDPAPHRERE